MSPALPSKVCDFFPQVKARLIDVLKDPIEDGTVSLCLDLYTGDYRKKAYLDVRAFWVTREFNLQHAALAVRHFGTASHTGDNISSAVNAIMTEYNLPSDDTTVTTDHGSNVVAALRNNVRLDCMCHRLHTVLETAWRDTKETENRTQWLARWLQLIYVVTLKKSTGLQEQLPKLLKHGGDTRPWVSMFRRSEAIEASCEALVTLLT